MPHHALAASPWKVRVLAFALALLLAVAWGTLVQTQFNLHALSALGVSIAPRVRLWTSAQDLAGFGPVYAGIVLAAWLPAFAAAAWLARRWPMFRAWLYPAAAGVGLVVAIRAIDSVAPMPVLIDATRGIAGLLSMVAGSVLGGALFAYWTRALRGGVTGNLRSNAPDSSHPADPARS